MFGKGSNINKNYACDLDETVDNNETSFYIEYRGDIFIFLDLNYTNGSSSASNDGYYYRKETLIWFANILEEFKDKRCFVFTHLFFKHKAGVTRNEHCYEYHVKQYGYSLQDGETFNQFTILNGLNNKYKNVNVSNIESKLKETIKIIISNVR